MNFISNLSNSFKKNTANTTWAITEKFIRIGLSFIVGIYVARFLGPSKLGILSYALSFVSLFKFFTDLGLERVIVRSLVTKLDSDRTLMGSAFILKLAGAFTLVFLVIITVHCATLESEVKWLITIIAAGMLFDPFLVIVSYFQSKVQIRYVTFSYFISIIITAAFRLFLIFIQAELIWFAIVVAVEQALLSFILIIFYLKKRFSLFYWKFKPGTAKMLLLSSWPLLLSSMSIMIYMRIDQIMIKSIIGNEGVGNYAVAVKLSELWYFIPVAINHSLFPALLEIKAQDPNNYKRYLQYLFDLMVLTAVIIAIPLGFLSYPLILILFGDFYLDAASALNIHIWSSIFVFIGVATNNLLLAENLQILTFYRTFIGCIINIVLNFILIPFAGIKGAAIATLISQSIVGYFSLLIFRNTRDIFFNVTQSFNIFASINRLSNISSKHNRN